MITSGKSAAALAAVLILSLSPPFLAAQDKAPQWNAAKPGKEGKPQMRMMKFDADKAVMIDEAGLVVTEADGTLKVEFLPPKEARPKETADLDIAQGDEIGMAAGKRVSTAKELREAYEAIAPGDEVKLGLRRDGKSFIVTFGKKDPKDLPKKMIIRRGPDEDPDTDVLPALGISIRAAGGELVIAETFPNAPEGMAGGDVVRTVNGKSVRTLGEFSGVYDNVKIGGELTFGLVRKGSPVTVTTVRPEPQGKMIIK